MGFAKPQGVIATWIGILRSFGAFFGVFGVILYTFVERKIGVRKTGLIGMIVSTNP